MKQFAAYRAGPHVDPALRGCIAPTRFRPDRFALLTVAIAVLGGALVLERVLIFGGGVTLSVDSANYVAAARSLLAGEGFLRYDGSVLNFPPLYPLLLAAASLGILDPVTVAGPLNAVIFGLTVFVVGQYLHRRLASRFLAAYGCLATALAAPLLEWSSWALSDALFVLLAMLALTWTDRFLTAGRRRALVWAAAWSALAWQARYIGGTVPALVGLLLLFQRGASMSQRARRVTAYSLIVAAPTASWLMRNLLTVGEFTAYRPPRDHAVHAVPMILRDVFDIVWSWAQTSTAAVLAPFVAVLVVVQSVQSVVQRRQFSVADVADRRDWRPFWLFGGFALIYVVLFIAIISLLVGIYLESGVSDRLLIPLYVPLLIAGVFVLDRVLEHERERRLLGSVGGLPIVGTMMPGRKRSVLVAIVTVVLSLGVVRQTVLVASAIVTEQTASSRFLGFNGPLWTSSETIAYVRENLVGARIYSNAPELLSLHIGRNREYAPVYRAPYLCSWLGGLRGPLTWDGAFVAWLSGPSNLGYDYDEADLRGLPGLETAAVLADGAVFKVRRRRVGGGGLHGSSRIHVDCE